MNAGFNTSLNWTANNTVNSSQFGNSSVATIPTWSELVTWGAVTIIILATGCINNFLVLYVTWPRAGDKSGVNLLIFHYIFANLLMCLIHNPIRCFTVLANASGYVISSSICGFVQTFNTASWQVILWADAGLALNRCVALFLPHSYKAYSSRRNNVFQIVLIWCMSLGMVIPANYSVGGVLVMLPIGHCAYRQVKDRLTVIFGLYTTLPFGLAGVASVMILVKCRFMLKAIQAMHSADDRVRHRIVVAKMLVLTFAWSLICNIPTAVTSNFYPRLYDRYPMLNLWMQTTVIGQYAFTACIILMSNDKYRDRLRLSVLTQRISPLENTVSHGHGDQRRSTAVLKMSGIQSVSHTGHAQDSK